MTVTVPNPFTVGQRLRASALNLLVTATVELQAVTAAPSWSTSTTTQTVGGVASTTVVFDWALIAAHALEVRFLITFPTAPTPGNFFSTTLPGSMPATTLSPGTSRGSYGTALGSPTITFNFCRLDPSAFYVFVNNNPNACKVWEGNLFATV